MPLNFAGYGISADMCLWERGNEKETLLLLYSIAVFIMEGIASANSVWDVTSFAGARPGAFPSATAGPVRPARPVTFLLNSRSCDCKTLCTLTQGSESDTTGYWTYWVYLRLSWSFLPRCPDLSALKFWQAKPSYRSWHRQWHFPSRRARVPPFWQGSHLHTLYCAM